jgi:hypothetical protein
VEFSSIRLQQVPSLLEVPFEVRAEWDLRECCQGAEISAAKHKRGRKKLCGAEYLPDLSQKGQKGAEFFLKFKTAKFLTEN